MSDVREPFAADKPEAKAQEFASPVRIVFEFDVDQSTIDSHFVKTGILLNRTQKKVFIGSELTEDQRRRFVEARGFDFNSRFLNGIPARPSQSLDTTTICVNVSKVELAPYSLVRERILFQTTDPKLDELLDAMQRCVDSFVEREQKAEKMKANLPLNPAPAPASASVSIEPAAEPKEIWYNENKQDYANLFSDIFLVCSTLKPDRKFESWVKEVVGVDRRKRGVYTFLGDRFISDETQIIELPDSTQRVRVFLACAVMGSNKYHNARYEFVTLDEFGRLASTGITSDDRDKGWALKVADQVESLFKAN